MHEIKTMIHHSKYHFITIHLVRRICAIYQYNCTKNGKGLKIGTKEADTK